ncbi:hypothetical protein D9M69_565170 [compost metagenome]
MESRERRLRVKIDGEDAMPCEGKVLREVGSRGRLARAALKIHDCDYLELVARLSLRNVFLRFALPGFGKVMAQLPQLFGGVIFSVP